MSRQRRELLVAGLGFLVLALALFHRLLFLGEAVHGRDAARVHHPVRVWLAERLAAHELPLWYPYESLGTPFIENAVTAVFHPLTWLLLVLDPIDAMTASLLVAAGFGFGATYLLARALDATEAGALAAGVVFVGSGAAMSSMDQALFYVGIMGYPVFALGALRFLRGEGIVGGALASLALASTILFGDVQAAFFYGLTALAMALVHPGRTLPRRLAGFLAIGLVGGALAAVQLLPSFAIVGQLERGAGLPWAEASTWSLHPLQGFELFFGDLTRAGPVRDAGEVLRLYGYRGRVPWLLGLGFGASTFALAAVALSAADRARKTPLLLFAGALLILWAAAGAHGGLYAALYHGVPGWRSFRYPQKLVPYAGLPLGLLAGLGLSVARAAPRRALVAVGVTLVALFGVGALARWAPDLVAGWVRALASPEPGTDLARASATYVARLGPACLLAAAYAGLAALPPLLLRGGLGAPLTVLILLVELTLGARHVQTVAWGPKDAFRIPAALVTVLDRLAGPRPGRWRVVTDFAETGLLGPKDDPTFLSTLAWTRQALLPSTQALDRVESLDGYLPAVPLRQVELGRSGRWAYGYAPLYNGVWLVTDRATYGPSPRPTHPIVTDARQLHLLLARAPGALPRAFVAAPLVAESPAEARARLDDPEVRAGRRAVVEATKLTATTTRAHGRVEVVSYRPERVELSGRLETPAMVVLNDSYWADWRASLSMGGVERSVSIARTNYLVRGVYVEAPGEFRLVFEYRPPPALWVGGAVSLVTALGLAVVLLRRRR